MQNDLFKWYWTEGHEIAVHLNRIRDLFLDACNGDVIMAKTIISKMMQRPAEMLDRGPFSDLPASMRKDILKILYKKFG